MIQQGEILAGIDSILSALSVSLEQESDPLTAQIYSTLAFAYQTLNDPLSCYYFERFYYLNQHLINEQRLEALTSLEVKYQTAQKENKILQLERQNLLQKERDTKIGIFLGGVITLLLLLLLGVANINRKAKIKQLQTKAQLQALQQEKDLSMLQSFFSGQEEERKRVALDLHDSLGGLLFALQLQVSQSNTTQSQQLVSDAITENRRIMQNLMPAAIEQLGLKAALEDWLETYADYWNIVISHSFEIDTIPNLMTRISIYRMVQELITNAARHAEANSLNVLVKQEEQVLSITVEDNGKGLDTNNLPSTFLKTIASRTYLLNGKYQVHSIPNQGTSVYITIPNQK